jgi:RNA polymerase sigma factor (sigma-70 family)
MSSTQIDPLLRFIRHLAGSQKDNELPDHQLLERFAANRDEASFAALLRRHGPMVLSVCQSVLHNLHDAEDVFQAAFLILARKAGSIQRREAVSSWLNRVAYHLAVKARASAIRRIDHEKKAAVTPSAEPLLDMSLRELQSIVHEEIQRLPEQYRAPVLLCGLEERSLEEAARLLGWSKGCVKGRLQRGREQLRTRLRRRGVELSAGLLAIALATSSMSAQISATLTASTLRAALQIAAGGELAAGVISANVAALARGAMPPMFVSKLKIVTFVVLAFGVSAAGLGALAHRENTTQPADPPSQESAKPATPRRDGAAVPVKTTAKDSVTVRGRVFGPDGKPFAGAKIYLHSVKSEEKAAPAIAASGADGRFEFSLSRSELDKTTASHSNPNHVRRQVMAMADGLGCDWTGIDESDRELLLRLVKDVPIRGRILDRDGKPVLGARVSVVSVAAYPNEDLTKMLEETRLRGVSGSAAKQWDGPLPGQAKDLTVAADGRFRLSGFGRERAVSLMVEGPAIAHTTIEVMTRAAEPVLGPGMPWGLRRATVYGARFDHLAEPSRPIRGVVRDKASGKPVAGVTLWSYLTRHRPISDGEGRYELLGYPKSAKYTFYAVPPDGRHFQRRIEINDTPGFDPLTTDIALPSGILVRGRVIDKTSGKPVAGVRVSYFLLFPNPNAGRLADYPEYEGLSSAVSGPDGSFAVTVLPGPGVLAAAAQPLASHRPAFVAPEEAANFLKSPPAQVALTAPPDALAIHGTGALANARSMTIFQPNYNALVLIKPTQKDKELVRDIELLPALSRQGTIVGPDDKPVTGVAAIGLGSSFDASGWRSPLKSASFTVCGLHPKRTRELFFYHKEKNWGRYLEIRGDRSEALKVKLQPCGSVAGRLIDKDAKPVVGTVVYFCRQGFGAFFPGGFQVKTDRDGRFQAEGLVPGQKYTMTRNISNIADTLPEIAVESGEKKDLGDIKCNRIE